MSDDQFTKLFKYMQTIRSEFDSKHDSLKAAVDRVYDLIDADLKRLENGYSTKVK